MFLNRSEVQKHLVAWGVNPEEANTRVDSLTDQEIDKIYGLTGQEKPAELREKFNDPEKSELYKKEKSRKLSAEEIIQMNEDIRKAREDVKTLAEKVISKVWKQ